MSITILCRYNKNLVRGFKTYYQLNNLKKDEKKKFFINIQKKKLSV